MTVNARQLRLFAASTLAVVPGLADANTQVSPGIGPLSANFNSMGGLVIDLVGTNSKRLTAQISPTNLPSGSVTDISQNFWAFFTQTGFDTFTLQTLLGGGLQKVNIRVTLQDGDSASPNPVYSAIFGATSMPHSGAGVRCPSCMGNNPTSNFRSHPPGADFDAGTDLYIAIPLAGGGYLSCGYMGQTTTHQVDANGNTIQSYTGFPGVYALTDYNTFPSSINRRGYTPFAVTGWFSVPSCQLALLYNTLATTGALTLGIWDIDPGDQYYDFTQGVAAPITDLPLIPPEILSFNATPSTVVGSGTVTLSWPTGVATSGALDQGITINPTQVNGSVQVPVSTATTYTLTASSPQGSTTATTTVTGLPPFNIATPALLQALAGSPYSMTVAATGGTPPAQWTLVSGNLPPGLTLGSTGTTTGTPTAAGAATFVLQANDNTIPKQAATAAYTLTVNPGLSIPPSPLPNAVASSPYTQPLTAAGGTPGYTWSLASGSLPPGLTLASSRTISGTPTGTGSTNFTLKAICSSTPTPQTATQAYSITMGRETRHPNHHPGYRRYSQALAAGGTMPYIWSVASGRPYAPHDESCRHISPRLTVTATRSLRPPPLIALAPAVPTTAVPCVLRRSAFPVPPISFFKRPHPGRKKMQAPPTKPSSSLGTAGPAFWAPRANAKGDSKPMTTLTPTANHSSTQTKFFTIAQIPDAVKIQLRAWERETMHELAPGLVAVSRSADDSDAEILDDLIRWLGTTGATVAGPFATLQLAAASQRLAA